MTNPEDEAHASQRDQASTIDEPEAYEKADVEDVDADDGSFKELAARLAVVQSNLENLSEDRSQLEDKIEKMESRMLQLGTIAEAVSNQYNPFITDRNPESPSWEESQPGVNLPGGGAGDDDEDPVGFDPPEEVVEEAEPPQPDPATSRAQDEEQTAPEPEPQLAQEPEEEPAEELGEQLGAFSEARERLGTRGDEEHELSDRLLMLEWVDEMLDRVGRANLLDLLEYYQGLGWLGPEMKDRVTRVAVGVDGPSEGRQDDWRGDVDLHRRSLITMERLRGNDVTAAEVENLQMSIERLFGE